MKMPGVFTSAPHLWPRIYLRNEAGKKSHWLQKLIALLTRKELSVCTNCTHGGGWGWGGLGSLRGPPSLKGEGVDHLSGGHGGRSRGPWESEVRPWPYFWGRLFGVGLQNRAASATGRATGRAGRSQIHPWSFFSFFYKTSSINPNVIWFLSNTLSLF